MPMSAAERKRNQRARERAGLEEGEHVLRAVEDMLGPAIAATVAALDLGPEDAAVVKLAERYAKVIDRAQDVGYAARWIGPLLLEVLGELGATPASRTKVKKASPKRAPNRLDELRAARRTPV